MSIKELDTKARITNRAIKINTGKKNRLSSFGGWMQRYSMIKNV